MPRNKPPSRHGGNGRGSDGDRKSPKGRFRPRDDAPRSRDSWRPDSHRDGERSRSRPNDDRSGRFDPPRRDFTFRMDKPPGVGESSHGGYGGHGYRREGRRDGGRRDQRKPGRGRLGRRWQPPPPPSQRALISGATLNLPEERLDGGHGQNKFRDLDELSDDDELDMDISSHSSDGQSQQPSTKRQRTEMADPSVVEAPKWSNPDPYTALPCPDDTTKKKRDVVKLIRKARMEEKVKLAAPEQAEDFLSFDPTEDEDEEDETSEESQSESDYEPPPPAIPTGPVSTLPTAPQLPPKPTPPRSQSYSASSDPLGSRKRTVDDEIKPPNYGQSKKAVSRPGKGSIAIAWRPKNSEDGCPWATVDHSATTDMAFRLHKEVIDFYEYVRPREFEQRIRNNLVDNLKNAMKRDGRNFGDAEVFPFGSFMSGLYLPTADMDIVVCSASFMRNGPATYLGARNWLYKFQKLLMNQKVADSEVIQVIAHARIPLVKFVDKFTGLKVDVSFEHLGGVDAIDTFSRWKQLYPSMPILVTVIKHYLLMRGLNEPVNGGIGGFSVICLVVSMLQLLPQVQSRSLIPEHNLGEMLLEFFYLYGHQFDYEMNAISLTQPVGYIRKSEVRSFTYKSTDRLSIIDPNNPENDIAGGSSNVATIFARFGETFDALRLRMKDVAQDPSRGGILDAIMKGDYSSFRQQRKFLKQVHEQFLGACLD